MPAGTYALSGHQGTYALERFRCGAGPAGWRYTATREHPGSAAPLGGLDVVLDGRGAAVRVQVEAAGWLLRGGTVGTEVLWRRGDEERSESAAGFTGTSPVWALAVTRLLAQAPGPVRLRLVRLGDEALATSVVEQSWVRTDASAEVARWEALDLATGERAVVQVGGDVVLEAPGARLVALDP